MRRQRPYRELPTTTLWWRKWEPTIVSGLNVRLLVWRNGVQPTAPEAAGIFEKLQGRQRKWIPVLNEIVRAADRAAGRKYAGGRGGQEGG
jgi:hypothetical protein